ncbi:hypothetical protein [Bacillus cereus group sp. MG11]|uniref:hypothetical protein n=1 Tax=Bacillus cereus group sp. MG11 TaxID=3040248 RepID=UPI00339A5E33
MTETAEEMKKILTDDNLFYVLQRAIRKSESIGLGQDETEQFMQVFSKIKKIREEK